MKIDSRLIKYILMNKFRFKDGLMVCSECCGFGGGIADIITYNHQKGIMVEIEIKISKSDLLVDLKKMKHRIYATKDKIGLQQFYYAVPSFLVNDALIFLETNNLKYGVIEIIENNIDGFDFNKMKDTSELIKVVKRCPRFNTEKPKDHQVHTFLQRLSSELVTREKELLLTKINL